MNRGDFQRLAEERLSEAQLLLAAGKWAGAYYLAGYAVECALKACILARIEREGVIFDNENKKFSEKCWTHDLSELVNLAKLNEAFEAWAETDEMIPPNCDAVTNWTETSRYTFKTQQMAEDLIEAIQHPKYGVLQWIRHYW